MRSSEIRQKFIDYFKKQGHMEVSSSSLIPENDPTLLFTNAGMNQFKNAFLGLEKRDYVRAVSSQKCVRAGGKHNDLENVGFTARHHTFFEMLGNFSFGDYFKKEAIHFAWDLLTNDFGIPKEKLFVTVFESDDEAADIWHKQEGVSRDRIFKLGEKDNFWRMGDVGPCGPCTEIFYDHGPQYGKESDPFKGILSGEDRFVEIWNLVFMQFDEKSPGNLVPLPKPSVDTGSGLERVVAALQEKHNNYNTDLFSPIIERACKLSGADYITDPHILNKNNEISKITAALRVLADHSRSVGFLIADGASPGPDGRGYVLRRIIRRALKFGRQLSATKSIFPGVVEEMVNHMGKIYPELYQRKEHILNVVKDEELKFLTTLDQGTLHLNDVLSHLSGKKISGETVFKLYDTYGFPVDLTELMASEKGYSIDRDGFEKAMESSKIRAKASWKGEGISKDTAFLIKWTQDLKTKYGVTQFTGYKVLEDQSEVCGLTDGHSETVELNKNGFVVTLRTPFYAESGGQMGDIGELEWPGGGAQILGCHKQNEIYLHEVLIKKGTLKKGDKLRLKVNSDERQEVARHHSATHLLHAALKNIVGNHVSQAGSSVEATRLRFDFTHSKPLTNLEIEAVEKLVNKQISLGLPVDVNEMSHKKALEQGAVALFGEKYGDQVRVLKMGDFSCELCGGTHVENTARIRLFKIVSESSVSSGVRRIEAVAGSRAIEYLNFVFDDASSAREIAGLKSLWSHFQDQSEGSPKEQLKSWVEQQKNILKNLERELKKAHQDKISIDDILRNKINIGEEAFLVSHEIEIDDKDVLAQVADGLKNKLQSGVIILLGKGESSNPLLVSVCGTYQKKVKAGDILKRVATIMGGKGGGRADFAQGAVPSRSSWEKAIHEIKTELQQGNQK